eukprot:2185887-Rhodomonas_salina.1
MPGLRSHSRDYSPYDPANKGSVQTTCDTAQTTRHLDSSGVDEKRSRASKLVAHQQSCTRHSSDSSFWAHLFRRQLRRSGIMSNSAAIKTGESTLSRVQKTKTNEKTGQRTSEPRGKLCVKGANQRVKGEGGVN